MIIIGKTYAMKRFFLFLCAVLFFRSIDAQELYKTYVQFVCDYDMVLFETCGRFEVTGHTAKLVYYRGVEEIARTFVITEAEYTERGMSYQFEDGSAAHFGTEGSGNTVWSVDVNTAGTSYEYAVFLIYNDECYGKTDDGE